MVKGKPVYSVIAVPPVSEKDVGRVFVQPRVPDELLQQMKREVRANEIYQDDGLSIFHVARTGAELEAVRQDIYNILNGQPQLVYAVTLFVTDAEANETFPVTVYLSTEGEDKMPEFDESRAVIARALDALPDVAQVTGTAPMNVRKFYSYGA